MTHQLEADVPKTPAYSTIPADNTSTPGDILQGCFFIAYIFEH